MVAKITKRDFLKLAGMGGVVFASGLPGFKSSARAAGMGMAGDDFHFVQLSDLHWGFKGLTKPGYITNTLTPYVGDANSQTPEFKAFLVNIEKA